MKYTKRFLLSADRDSFINSANYIEPHASYTIEDEFVQYNKLIPADYYQYFNFKSDDYFEVGLNPNHPLVSGNEANIEYSFDLETWYTLPSSWSADVDNIIYLRGNNLNGLDGTSQSLLGVWYSLFIFYDVYETVEACGNIMSLIYGDDFIEQTEIPVSHGFTSLFMGLLDISSAANLILPATTLSQYCYEGMFSGCTSLTTAPELPATTLSQYCYLSMFSGCTSLTEAPELPATTLTNWCYSGMFSGCTSLTEAPELPATTLSQYCYLSMFYGCTSLTTPPELPATTLSQYCYLSMFYGCTSLTTAPELPAITIANSCYSQMFFGCTSLTTAPELPATTLVFHCYHGMFSGCTSLTTAPELPATTLVNYCYSQMFSGCTSLNYIKAMFTTTPGSTYTTNWVKNVAATGTFVKNSAAVWDVTGDNGIPSGWTVQTASA